MRTSEAFLMAAGMAMMAESMMNSGVYCGYTSGYEGKTKLSPKQKQRRKNSKIAKMSRKKNRRK